MKKIAIIGVLSLCAAGAFAQGSLVFGDYNAEGLYSEIYSPNTANTSVETYGNTSSQNPVGTQQYPAGQYTPIGGSAGTGQSFAYGNQFTVQIYWTPNTYVPSHLTAGSTFLPAIMATIETPQAAYNATTTLGQGNGNPSPSYISDMGDGTANSNPAGYFNANTATDNGLFGDVQTHTTGITMAYRILMQLSRLLAGTMQVARSTVLQPHPRPTFLTAYRCL